VAQGFEFDWIVVRVQTIRKLAVVAGIALLAAAVLALAFYLLDQPPQTRARNAIERASAVRDQISQQEIPDSWHNELDQADAQLEAAREAYLDEQWEVAIEQADQARQRLELFLGAGDAQVVGAGQILSFDGRVTVQRGGASQWDSVHRRMPLYNGDFVKTGADGSAEIIFADGTVYRVSSDSLLEIHQRAPRPDANHDVKMMTGRVNVLTSSSPSTVATDQAQTHVNQDSRVAVDVADETGQTTVAAYSGGARVSNRAGQTVSLRSREHVSTTQEGGLSDALPIPRPPELVAPRPNAVFPLQQHDTLELRWRALGPARGFHLQVSRSKLFRPTHLEVNDVPRSKSNARLQLNHAGLYYWRVASLNDRDIPSEWSVVRRFQVTNPGGHVAVDDTTPPRLEVQPAQQLGQMFIVEGVTEPGAEVTINDESVELDSDGSFRKAVEVKREGFSELEVVATDAAGNQTKRTQRVFVEVF
jgi:hypothetical protein